MVWSFCRESDVIIGALDDHLSMSEHFVATYPYYSDELTWCVQKSQQLPMWKNIFKLCKDPTIYLLFFIMCTACAIFIFFMQQFEDVRPKWDYIRISITIVRCYCGLGIEYKPKLHSTRIFIASCLLSSFLFDITYILLWTKYMTTPLFESQIQSRQEIIDNRFEMVGDGFALQQLIKQNEVNHIDFAPKYEKIKASLYFT